MSTADAEFPMNPLELGVMEGPSINRRPTRPRTKSLNLMDKYFPLPKCVLCRKTVRITRHRRIGEREDIFLNWNSSCAESVREFLNLDVSFQEPLAKATYCQECFCIIRDIDFCLKTIKSLQRRLESYRPAVESYLRNNHIWVQHEYGDDGDVSSMDIESFSQYDHLVHRICQAASLIDPPDVKVLTSYLASDNLLLDPQDRTYSEPATTSRSRDKRQSRKKILLIKSETEEAEPDNDSDPDILDPLSNLDNDSDWTASEAGPRRGTKKPRTQLIKKAKKYKTTIRKTASVAKLKPETQVLTCATCSRTFLHKRKFHAHLRDHERSVTRVAFRCSTCNKKFLQNEEQEYQAHVELHQLKFNEQSNFSCVMPYCDKICVNNVDLKQHVKEEHEDSTSTKCDLCGLICAHPIALKRHKSDMHSEKNPAFKCQHPNCSYHGNGFADLKNHSFKHAPEKSFACTVCDRKFSWRNSMRNHMRQHDAEKKFKCSFANCDKSFTIGEYLRRHENSVHCTIRNFLCTSCPKSFKSNKGLQQHINFFHLGIRRSGLLNAHDKQTNNASQSDYNHDETGESETDFQKSIEQSCHITGNPISSFDIIQTWNSN